MCMIERFCIFTRIAWITFIYHIGLVSTIFHVYVYENLNKLISLLTSKEFTVLNSEYVITQGDYMTKST